MIRQPIIQSTYTVNPSCAGREPPILASKSGDPRLRKSPHVNGTGSLSLPLQLHQSCEFRFFATKKKKRSSFLRVALHREACITKMTRFGRLWDSIHTLRQLHAKKVRIQAIPFKTFSIEKARSAFLAGGRLVPTFATFSSLCGLWKPQTVRGVDRSRPCRGRWADCHQTWFDS